MIEQNKIIAAGTRPGAGWPGGMTMQSKTLLTLIQAACAAAMLCGAGAARAEVPASGVAHMERARAGFIALVNERGDKSRLPKLSEPDAAVVMKALFDARAVLGSGPYTVVSMKDLARIRENYFEISSIYAFFTEGETESEQRTKAAVYENELAEFNIIITRLLASLCAAYEDISVFAETTPAFADRREASRSYRRDMVEAVVINIDNMTAEGIGQANRARMATALSEQAGAMGRALQMDERDVVVQTIEAVTAVMPDARASLEAAVAAIKAAPCEGTCRLKVEGKI
jgi:hypothetical protein